MELRSSGFPRLNLLFLFYELCYQIYLGTYMVPSTLELVCIRHWCFLDLIKLFKVKLY